MIHATLSVILSIIDLIKTSLNLLQKDMQNQDGKFDWSQNGTRDKKNSEKAQLTHHPNTRYNALIILIRENFFNKS